MYINDTFKQPHDPSTRFGSSPVFRSRFDQIDYDPRSRTSRSRLPRPKLRRRIFFDPYARQRRHLDRPRDGQAEFRRWHSSFRKSRPYEKPFTDSLGKYSNDVLNCVPWYDVKNQRTKDILQLSQKPFREHGFMSSTFTFECIEIAADAIKRAGSATQPASTRLSKQR